MKTYLIFLFVIIFSLWFNVYGHTNMKIGNQRKKRIVGGKSCSLSKHPYFVSIISFSYDRYKHVCGGSILNEKLILTSRHCCENHADFWVAPSVERKDIMTYGYHKVSKYTFHHPLTKDLLYMCFLFLEFPIKFSNNIKSVSISKVQKNCSTAEIIGFGVQTKMTSGGDVIGFNTLFNPYLQCACIKIYFDKDCKKFEPSLNTAKIFCVSHYKSPCFQDEGGPVICNEKQIGIIFTVHGCGTNNSYAEIAKIDDDIDVITYLPSIHNNTLSFYYNYYLYSIIIFVHLQYKV